MFVLQGLIEQNNVLNMIQKLVIMCAKILLSVIIVIAQIVL